jgi:diadenosine tetraphosphate (Ap4A) HIT family hydrolase
MSPTFERLSRFIEREMRMSHLYQPVMLAALLRRAGRASRCDIAGDILAHDPTQLEYYEQIVTNMVGRVLTAKAHLIERSGREFRLVGDDALSPAERQELIGLCEAKVDAYLAARGAAMWQHRRRGHRALSGTLRYDVLKRARFRCELCGISADEKALEVDHILPRRRGGSEDQTNLQALCYSCNASKRDRDDTDFRGSREMYAERRAGCLFCELPAERVVEENELAVVIRDAFAVTELHTLIIPKRHVGDYFALTQPEVNATHQLLTRQRLEIQRSDVTVEGFNVGTNNGAAAGQTIFHCHLHLIPRRRGDSPNPRGGVRHVIAGKGAY